ncbi:MAG TPA: right-handed parallel beta-helix repeat-containing protein [Kofleriaceae bacterium]|nr:right-handed parallel beta-helix repeat-containing protein [Kofleriaceae bacterium]
MWDRARLVVALIGVACQPRLPAGSSAEPPGLICDGRADDTRALQRALDRGGRVALPASRVCRFSSLTISVPVALDLAGATLTLSDGAPPGPFVRILADHVAIRDGTIDGARERGATGWLVDWHGGDGSLDTVTLQNGDSIGLSVTAADARVVARRVVARGFGGALGIGFRVGAGALVAEDCGAETSSYAGFFVSQTASSATVIDGWTRRNGAGVVIEGQRGGRVARLHSHDDDRFGLLLDHGASGWQVGAVRVEATGRSARNRSGTGVELFAQNRRNVFDEVVVTGAAGYGLAIAGDSDDNRFGRVELDARGAWDGDPGLLIAGGSDRNRIDSVRVLGHTIGIRIGENDLATDAPSNANRIGSAYVSGARYNAIRFERGDDNAIRQATIADSDSSGSDAQGFKGLVYFGNDSSGNRIGELVQADTRRIPNYIVYAGPCAVATCVTGAAPTDNRVERVTARGWSVEVAHGVTP